MGEIAEMMLNGFLDEETGEVIDGTEPGYPRRMSDALAAVDKPPVNEIEQARRRRKRRARRARLTAKRRADAAAALAAAKAPSPDA